MSESNQRSPADGEVGAAGTMLTLAPPSLTKFNLAFTSSYETEILVCIPSVTSFAATS